MEFPIRSLRSSDPADSTTATLWLEAARAGAFGLVDHGVSSAVRDACVKAAQSFHCRSEPWKEAVAIERSLGNRGYVGADLRRVDGRIVRDYASLDFGPESASPPGTDPLRDILLGPNLWPQLPGFEEAVRAYLEAMKRCADQVARLMSAAAGLEPDHLTQRSVHGISLLRLLHYPEAAEPDQDIGKGHTDYEWFTLIWQSSAGLEVMDGSGHVQTPPAEPDVLIVLIGDLLEVVSNGRLQSTLHWVRPQSADRYSLTYFYGPDFAELISPLGPPATSAGYPSLPAGEHLTGLRVRHFQHLRTAVQEGRLRLPFPLPTSNPLKVAKLQRFRTGPGTGR